VRQCGRPLGRPGHSRSLTLGFAVLIALSYALMAAGREHVVVLIVGVFVLDVGVQGLHITNFSVVLGLEPQARSRINANYMVAYFAGGAIGSALASALYDSAGWPGVCALGAAVGVVAALIGVFDWLSPVSAPAPAQARRSPCPPRHPASAERPRPGSWAGSCADRASCPARS